MILMSCFSEYPEKVVNLKVELFYDTFFLALCNVHKLLSSKTCTGSPISNAKSLLGSLEKNDHIFGGELTIIRWICKKNEFI